MATIRSVEHQIHQLEGFRVRMLHGRDRRDVRSDKTNIPGYGYQRQLTGSKTVKEWRDGRFRTRYPGFDVEVLDVDGNVSIGQAYGGNIAAPCRDQNLGDRRLHGGVDIGEAEEGVDVAADLRRGQEQHMLRLDVVEAEHFQENRKRFAGRVVDAGDDDLQVGQLDGEEHVAAFV